jgi:hypothetical protein
MRVRPTFVDFDMTIDAEMDFDRMDGEVQPLRANTTYRKRRIDVIWLFIMSSLTMSSPTMRHAAS